MDNFGEIAASFLLNNSDDESWIDGSSEGVRKSLSNLLRVSVGSTRQLNPKPLSPMDPTGLNPGIRELVRRLRAVGFQTIDSGDGQTHEFGCDREYPYVAMTTFPGLLLGESHRLQEWLKGVGVEVQSLSSAEDDSPTIFVSYSPTDGIPIIELHGVVDSMLSPEVK